MSFPRYPKYKPSLPAEALAKAGGVEWLGEVPAHWDVLPLKRSFSIVGGSTPKSDTEAFWDGDILWATPADLSKRDSVYINDTQRKITADGLASCGTTLVPAESIILSTRAPIGSLAIAESAMCTNQGCKSLVPLERSDTEYFAHLLSVSSAELNIRGKGTTFLEISGDELGAFKTPVPPLPEQTRIAEFLDRETAKIDELVAEQRRLMELLKEKRQAVISHAVTRGLNPKAPLKPSGIEWLGDVPTHWDVKQLGYLCSKIGSGKTPLGGAEAYINEGILFIRSQNVYDEGLFLDDVVFVTEVTDAEQPWSRVLPGDILLNITGASLGRTCLVPAEFAQANVNQHVCILRLFDPAQREYVALVLKSSWMKAQFDSAQTGAAREGLNFSQISKLVLAVPPTGEQTKITDFLHLRTAEFDTLTAEAQRAIDLLQERRTALISAAVTGQIDVRAALSP